MTAGILLNADDFVKTWAFEKFNRVPIHVHKAVGVVEGNEVVGAALFTNYNTVDAHLSYYGKWTLTRGICKCLAQIALSELRLARCTVIVPKRPAFLLRKLPKFGFRFEGIQRRYYGPTDSARFTGCRFVMFKEDMEKIAGLPVKKVA